MEKPNPKLGSSNNNTCSVIERTLLSKSIMESRIKALHCFMGGHDSAQNTNPSPTPSAGLDRSYYVEEHLEVECPKRFNLSPSVKSLVKKSIATFDAGFRSNYKNIQNQS